MAKVKTAGLEATRKALHENGKSFFPEPNTRVMLPFKITDLVIMKLGGKNDRGRA